MLLGGNILVGVLLSVRALSEAPKAEDLFEMLDKTTNDLNWEVYISVRAQSISSRYEGLQTLICCKILHVVWTLCNLYREALVSNSLSLQLNLALECVVDVVN
ncbi:hypothetical protein X975_16385, partial [Stegodyphus mimosarum]